MTRGLRRSGRPDEQPQSRLVIRAGANIEIVSVTTEAVARIVGDRVIVTGGLWSEATVADAVTATEVQP
jgi:hypothetical protein